MTGEELLPQSDEAFEPPNVPGGLGYKLGLVGCVGLGIWVIVTALSPATLVDTTDLPDDAPTVAELAELDPPPRDEPTALNASGTLATEVGDELAAGSKNRATLVVGADGGAVTTTGTDGSTAPSAAGDTTTSAQAAATAAAQAAGSPDGGPGSSASSSPAASAQPAASSTAPPSSAAPATTAPATTGPPASAAPATAAVTGSLDYRSNLDMIRRASVRNRNHDSSPHRNTPSASLTPSNHHGPRSDYLNHPGGNPERSFPVANGGQFRTGCEFSHFAYDDPLVYPGKPGASHLHMYFGNTDVNAFSTYESLLNSGSSTCNGQELNRTGYWVPALFDGNGNVRIPERVVVYYKGEGRARGNAEVYPAGAAIIATENLNALPANRGGGTGKYSFVCSDNYSTNGGAASQTMPACNGSQFGSGGGHRVVLEMNVKFPQCWNGGNPADWENSFKPPPNGWYGSNCTGSHSHILPNLEYFVNYVVEPGENTRDWFLASDVDPTSFGASKARGGSTVHGDWWGGWHAQTNRTWIDNCVNYRGGAPSGCGFGYLSDGGPNGRTPAGGPALKMRPQWSGSNKVPAETLMRELCPSPRRSYSKPEDAAYCAPGTGL